MVSITMRYEGDLRCTAEHGPSKSTITTDAPVDNHGKGEAFSPTDLVGAALGTCMMTIVGIAAARHGVDVRGMTARTEKVMVTEGLRRIKSLRTVLTIPIAAGRLRLGTWQGIYLCEHRDHGGPRRLVITAHGDV